MRENGPDAQAGMVGVFLGLDVGKNTHHGHRLTPIGKKVFAKPLPNSESPSTSWDLGRAVGFTGSAVLAVLLCQNIGLLGPAQHRPQPGTDFVRPANGSLETSGGGAAAPAVGLGRAADGHAERDECAARWR
ncbi:hypothetical protein [Streptomyces sp. 061-3]|uniref:hypothetical protein n=1 Tax=Streptomyces sp. 061-3 TaxID=2789268 RepID=UPI00397EDF4A